LGNLIVERGKKEMAKIIASTKDMAREQWLELRQAGIGGSDAAAVAGVSKYASPLTLYMEKRGTYKRPQTDTLAEAANWGNIMEPVLRAEFKKRINEERAEKGLKPIWVQQRHAIFAHDEFDFMRTNLDGQIFGHEAGTGILEIKTASEYLKEDWEGEDVPNQYYIQVQHNIKVMEADYAYLAVLIGGNKYKHYFIERDDETINYLVGIEHNFWHNHVEAKIPPVTSGNDAEAEMMKIMYPNSYDEPVIELPIEFKEVVERHEDLKEQEKEIKAAIKEARNNLTFELKEQAIAWAGPHQVTFKANKNGVKSLKIKLNKREAVK
jgi:putative phage-type endonuclease